MDQNFLIIISFNKLHILPETYRQGFHMDEKLVKINFFLIIELNYKNKFITFYNI